MLHAAALAVEAPLAGTQPLTLEGDLSAQMVAGISRFLDRETEKARADRFEKWKARDTKDAEPMRKLLRERLGMSDAPMPSWIEVVQPLGAKAAEDHRYRSLHVRWPVFADMYGEGILFQPRGESRATIVAVPDADQPPEMWIPPQHLADRGCTVLVPVLVDRRTTWSGTPLLDRWTNLPHREWIYRQAFEVGRTLAGYEVQKVLCALDALGVQDATKCGMTGAGEGGLIALHAAALDPRIDCALVSGSFGPHERRWEEPIDRNYFRYARDFGDSELAALIAPRALIVEPATVPAWTSPPPVEKGRRSIAAPGTIHTLPLADVRAEVERATQLGAQISLVEPEHDEKAAVELGVAVLLEKLGWARSETREQDPLAAIRKRVDLLVPTRTWYVDIRNDRQRRTVRELEAHTQAVLSKCEFARNAADLWKKLKPGDEWNKVQTEARRHFDEDVIGKLPTNFLPPNARSRVVLEKEKWTAYDVMLDVHPDIFAWGVLLLPKDLKPGERRPVVVCQHGLEGVPMDTITDDPKERAFAAYKGFAARLADRGFIVFAPHNPYRGKDEFRTLQRKAQPLGWSLFSFINAQHEVLTRWLAGQPFVDPARIAFYGLSYGGKTAMRTPAVVERYCLSICSADFNEWVRKNASVEYPGSYMFTGEYEIFEWDLGHTFNYAEMALLIAPRPFMVERGHDDGVGTSEWVGYEWGKVRRGYDKLGLGERAEIEWFNGPHTIHGVGTFKFLHRHLGWPEKAKAQAPNFK